MMEEAFNILKNDVGDNWESVIEAYSKYALSIKIDQETLRMDFNGPVQKCVAKDNLLIFEEDIIDSLISIRNSVLSKTQSMIREFDFLISREVSRKIDKKVKNNGSEMDN